MLLLLAGLVDVISLTPAVYRLSDLLGKLEAGGVKYSCSPDIRNEVILVKAGPQTPEKWRTLLARAAGGKWDQSGTRWNLRSLDQSAIDRVNRDKSLEKWVGPNFSDRLPGHRYPTVGETWGTFVDANSQSGWAKADVYCSRFFKFCEAKKASALVTVNTGSMWTETAFREITADGSSGENMGEPETMENPVEVVDSRVLEDETWAAVAKADGSLPVSDPFKFAEPVLLKYCSALEGEYVINLPDGLFSDLPKGKPTVGRFRQVMDYYGPLELSDGIWQSKLRLPQTSREQRVPVEALLSWTRKQKGDPFPSLKERGQFFDAVGDGFYLGGFKNSFWPAVGVLPAWDSAGESVSYGKYDQLRFFSRLNLPALSTLREGKSISVGDLPTGAQASLARMIFNRQVSFVNPPTAIAGGNYAGIFAQGDPVTWRISAAVKRNQVVMAADGPFRNSPFNAKTAGYLVYQQDRDPSWRDQGGYPDLRRHKLRTGIEDAWSFSLATPTFTLQFDLKDCQIDAGKLPVPYKSLPEEVMQEMNATIKYYESTHSKIPPP